MAANQGAIQLPPGDSVRKRQWQAARVCAAIVCVLIALMTLLPWFTVTGLRLDPAAGKALGIDQIPYRATFTPWEISWPIALGLIFAVLLGLYALAKADADEHGDWLDDAVTLLWVAGIACTTISAVFVFKLVEIPGLDAPACHVTSATGPTGATGPVSDLGTCLGGLHPPLITHIAFAAVSSLVLSLVLVGCAAWASQLQRTPIEPDGYASPGSSPLG